MRQIELLQAEDALATASQVVRGRAAHAAHADHDRVEFAHPGYAATTRFRL